MEWRRQRKPGTEGKSKGLPEMSKRMPSMKRNKLIKFDPIGTRAGGGQGGRGGNTIEAGGGRGGGGGGGRGCGCGGGVHKVLR
eukprot:172337-Hanusia_phi.AAC.1